MRIGMVMDGRGRVSVTVGKIDVSVGSGVFITVGVDVLVAVGRVPVGVGVDRILIPLRAKTWSG